MALLPFTQTGQGPDLVLLHGVGVGPPTFSVLADALAADHRVTVVDRHPSGAPVRSLEDQADRIVATVEATTSAPPLVVGVSGGATLGLVLALRHPAAVAGLVLHEPLVGAHAPALHRRFRTAAARAALSDEAALEVVRDVVGQGTWDRLDGHARAAVVAGAARARTEIPLFAGFAPTAAALARLCQTPILTTVGAASGDERHDAAAALVELAGATAAVVPGSGNAVQLDAPAAFADLIRAWQPVAARCGG